MLLNKTKIRISEFVLLLIESDCQEYGFFNGKNEPNKNMLINRILPILVKKRKERRIRIHERFELLNIKGDTDRVIYFLDGDLDSIYFGDEELNYLTRSIWFRPHNNLEKCITEIEESELKITLISLSQYIRSLLNEYARLPRYKRCELILHHEIDLIKQCIADDLNVTFIYDKLSKYIINPYHYTFVMFEERNILVGYDINKGEIRSFDVSKISKADYAGQSLPLSMEIMDKLEDYCDNMYYIDNKIIKV